MTPADLEVAISLSPSLSNDEIELITLYFSVSHNGVRPDSVYGVELDTLLLFGKDNDRQKSHVSERQGRLRKGRHKHHAIRTSSVSLSDLQLLAYERDPAYFLDVAKSKDNKFLLIHHHSKSSSEVSALDINESKKSVKTLIPRLKGQQCFVNHAHDSFYVAVSSDPNDVTEELTLRSIDSRKYLSTPLVAEKWERWDAVWPCSHNDVNGRNTTFILDDYDIFDKHIVVYARDKSRGGDISIQLLEVNRDPCEQRTNSDAANSPRVKFVKAWNGKDFLTMIEKKYSIEKDFVNDAMDCVWTVSPSSNGNFLSKTVSFSLSSAVIPEVIVSINLETTEVDDLKCRFSSLVSFPRTQREERNTTLLQNDSPSLLDRITKMLGAHHTNSTPQSEPLWRDVHCQKVMIESNEDEYLIPLVIYKPRNIDFPCRTLLIGYGAYGVSVPTHYDSQVSTYLHRGWIVAIAGVRGGGELGKIHHHSGKELNKWNSFLDFKDCAKYLIAEGLTSSDLLCASGNSAGGLVMGVMMNNFSNLFRAFVMRNPFLDIANSVTDADSPLTIHEYDEWGDVHSEGNANTNPSQILKYIQSYSPHSNINELSLSSVNPRVLPSVLITVGIQDDRVDPEQSLQWMQLLREKYKQLDAGNSPALLLNIRNEGHDGAATVEEQGHVEAIELAFLEKETRSD